MIIVWKCSDAGAWLTSLATRFGSSYRITGPVYPDQARDLVKYVGSLPLKSAHQFYNWC
jgi:hypothetical protein